MERTFVAIKPDGVRRGLIGEIVSRFEKKGFKIVSLKMMTLSRKAAEEHYKEHIGKNFFEPLVAFITSGSLVAMTVEGENAISEARKMMGKTNPQEALPGTIRGDFGQIARENLVHGSDSAESAIREIALFDSL